MIKFRTEIAIKPYPFGLSLQDHLFFMGSCFAENMAKLLIYNKFNVLSNPFGTIFNPISLFRNLEILLEKRKIDENFFVQNQDLFFHYDVHSQIFGKSPEDFLMKTQRIIQKEKAFLDRLFSVQNHNCIFLTFGTAWIYELKANAYIVNNCHKMSQNLFEKRLLEIDEIIEAFSVFYENLATKPHFVLTLSPVRHLKDGLPENSLSKAVLRVAVAKIIKKYPEIVYFPSYELFLDDLRDYRFCESDNLHPNALAIAYIFEKFGEAFFDENTKKWLKKWTNISQRLSHKAFFEASHSHKIFLRQLLKDLEAIQEVSVAQEIAYLKKYLQSLENL